LCGLSRPEQGYEEGHFSVVPYWLLLSYITGAKVFLFFGQKCFCSLDLASGNWQVVCHQRHRIKQLSQHIEVCFNYWWYRLICVTHQRCLNGRWTRSYVGYNGTVVWFTLTTYWYLVRYIHTYNITYISDTL
jgi:hypothetical protein